MTRTVVSLLALGLALFVVSTAVFHPHQAHPMDHREAFLEYADHSAWIVVHLVQWLAALLVTGGLYLLGGDQAARGRLAGRLARLGAILTAAAFTALQAVDGVALKWAVDQWAAASPSEQPPLFAAALAIRWTEYAFQGYANILLGLTLLALAVASARDARLGGWKSLLPGISAAAWITHGLMVPYVGLFDSLPRLIAIVSFAAWLAVAAPQAWRAR